MTETISQQCEEIIKQIQVKQVKFGISATEIKNDISQLHHDDLLDIFMLYQLFTRLNYQSEQMKGIIENLIQPSHQNLKFTDAEIQNFKILPLHITSEGVEVSNLYTAIDLISNAKEEGKFLKRTFEFLNKNPNQIDYFAKVFIPSVFSCFITDDLSELFLNFITNVHENLSEFKETEKQVPFLINLITSFIFCDFTFIKSLHNMLTLTVTTNKNTFLKEALTAFCKSIPSMRKHQQQSLLKFLEWYPKSEGKSAHFIALICTIIQDIIEIDQYSSDFYASNRLSIIDNQSLQVVQDIFSQFTMLSRIYQFNEEGCKKIYQPLINEIPIFDNIIDSLHNGIYQKPPDYSKVLTTFPKIVISRYDEFLLKAIMRADENALTEYDEQISKNSLICLNSEIFGNKSQEGDKESQEEEQLDDIDEAQKQKWLNKWKYIQQKSNYNGTPIFNLIPGLTPTGESTYNCSEANKETLFMLNQYKQLVQENENAIIQAVGSIGNQNQFTEGWISPRPFSLEYKKELSRLLSTLSFKLASYRDFRKQPIHIENFNKILDNEILLAYLNDFCSSKNPPSNETYYKLPNQKYVVSLSNIISKEDNIPFEYLELKKRFIQEVRGNTDFSTDQIHLLQTFINLMRKAISIHYANSINFAEIKARENSSSEKEADQITFDPEIIQLYWPYIYESSMIIEGLNTNHLLYNYGSICLLFIKLRSLIFPILQMLASRDDSRVNIQRFIAVLCSIPEITSKIELPYSVTLTDDQYKTLFPDNTYNYNEENTEHFNNICNSVKNFIIEEKYSNLSLNEEKTLLLEFFNKFI